MATIATFNDTTITSSTTNSGGTIITTNQKQSEDEARTNSHITESCGDKACSVEELPIKNAPTITSSPVAALPNLSINSPAQIVAMMKEAGRRKAELTFDQIILLSLMAGAFIGLGGILTMMTAGNSLEMETNNPGVQKFFFAA